MSDVDDLVGKLMQAHMAGTALPLPSQLLGDLDVAGAYRVQDAFVAARLSSDTIGGYKAALTAQPAQEAFGLEMPVTGVLYAGGLVGNDSRIERADFRSLLLETEFGYRLGQPLSEPVSSVEALREQVAAAFPMVELADPGFGEAKAGGIDLVAANSASSRYLGEPQTADSDWQDVDLNAVEVTFSRDGEILHEATAADVMGDQWQALLWLVNQIVSRGYTIEPAHVLMTGSIGGLQPGAAGAYVADYGNFGQLRFEIA